MQMRERINSRFYDRLHEGGVRQSSFTLIQSALGAGFLTLPYGMYLAGLGLGTAMLLVDGIVVYLGMEIMLRGAVKFEADNTATLLSKCVGEWSRPVLDLLLVCFGAGSCIAFLCMLGDIIPGILNDMVALGWMDRPSLTADELRARCIIGTLICIIPMAIPPTLSALRYVAFVAVAAVFGTAGVILYKCHGLYMEHVDLPTYGDVEFFKLDANFFKVFGIFLYAYNCHLNMVPVASELQHRDPHSIQKICANVVTALVTFYAVIAWGGYLSFLGQTNANVLTNYGLLPSVTICRWLLVISLGVSVPMQLTPTVRSCRSFIQSMCISKRMCAQEEALLDHSPGGGPGTTSSADKVQTLILKAICLFCEVGIALRVTSIADVMGFLGASVGTILMMVVPLAVLLKARCFEDWSAFKFFSTVLLLSGTTMVSCVGIAVMILQSMGYYPTPASG